MNIEDYMFAQLAKKIIEKIYLQFTDDQSIMLMCLKFSVKYDYSNNKQFLRSCGWCGVGNDADTEVSLPHRFHEWFDIWKDINGARKGLLPKHKQSPFVFT